MLIFLTAAGLFAVVLFWQSTGAPIRLEKHGLLAFYCGLALLTLVFQIYVRSQECERFAGCALSFAKATVWAAIWPASWIVYFAGL